MKKVDLSSGTRVCCTCNQEKAVSEFYAQRHPGRKTAEAPRRECKTCYNKQEYLREQEQKRLDQYVVRDWHGEIKLVLAGLFTPPHAFVDLHGVRRKQWGA